MHCLCIFPPTIRVQICHKNFCTVCLNYIQISSTSHCWFLCMLHAWVLQSCPMLCDPWTVAYQAPLSMGFSRQEYCSGLLCPPPGDLPDPGIEPVSLTSHILAGRFFITSATWEAHACFLLLLLLLSRFSRVQLCATPSMAAHQAPPSLGFSRQEHWSGLPFPSPMHESEKSK